MFKSMLSRWKTYSVLMTIQYHLRRCDDISYHLSYRQTKNGLSTPDDDRKTWKKIDCNQITRPRVTRPHCQFCCIYWSQLRSCAPKDTKKKIGLCWWGIYSVPWCPEGKCQYCENSTAHSIMSCNYLPFWVTDKPKMVYQPLMTTVKLIEKKSTAIN